MSNAGRPVFVVGCPRSGTTLLYHMLLSAGGFAVYLAESNVFNLLVPRFGDLSVHSNREKLVSAWIESKLFRASFLDREQITIKLLRECKSGGDFLRIVMGEIARQQRVVRWADNSPEELLHAQRIKREIPDAIFIHVIRDGRDVALSLDARPHAWVRPFSWDQKNSLQVCGLFWEWIVTKGRKCGRQLGCDYLEIHFEQLHSDPGGTLAKLGEFIDHDLDLDSILKVGIGAVSDPNTSFKGDRTSPVGRWQEKISPEKLALFESMVGPTLNELGYPPVNHNSVTASHLVAMRTLYRRYFETKFWFKNSALGRIYLGPMSGSQIDNTVIGTDPLQTAVPG